MGAPALAGAPHPAAGGTVCSPRRGPGLAPTRDPAAADAVFPNRARDTRQRVAHPASGTAAPAPSLARSQRRVQPQRLQGALGLRDVPHAMRELEGPRGVPWPWGRGVGTQGTALGRGVHGHTGVHWCVCRLGVQAGAVGRPGVFVGRRVQRVGVQGLGVQGLPCSPTHACAGVCPGPWRGRRRGRARGPRVCPEPWEPLWVFPGAPSAARAGHRDTGGTRPSCPHPPAVGARTHLPGDTHAAPTVGTVLALGIDPYWEHWDENSLAAGAGGSGEGSQDGVQGCEPPQHLGWALRGALPSLTHCQRPPLLSAASGGPGHGDVTLWRGTVSRLVPRRATDASCGCLVCSMP